MRGFFRLFLVLLGLFCAVLVLVRQIYNLTWRESLEVVDQFVEDLFS